MMGTSALQSGHQVAHFYRKGYTRLKIRQKSKTLAPRICGPGADFGLVELAAGHPAQFSGWSTDHQDVISRLEDRASLSSFSGRDLVVVGHHHYFGDHCQLVSGAKGGPNKRPREPGLCLIQVGEEQKK